MKKQTVYLKMKMSKEYWYGHYAEADLNRHKDRKEVLRPSGLFVLDGKSICRSDHGHHQHDHAITDAQSMSLVAEQSKTSSSSVLRSPPKALRTAAASAAAIQPPSRSADTNRYYSRFPAPEAEVLGDYKDAVRAAQVRAFKHIYHDDRFLTSPAKNHNPTGSSPQRMMTADRLLLPSTKRTQVLESVWSQQPLPQLSPQPQSQNKHQHS